MSDKMDVLYFNKNGECISNPPLKLVDEMGWLTKHEPSHQLENCLAIRRHGFLYSINEELKSLDYEIELTNKTWKLASDKEKNKYHIKQPKVKSEKGIIEKKPSKKGVRKFENKQRISEQALEYILNTTNERYDSDLGNINKKRCTVQISPSKKRYFFIRCVNHEERTASLQIYVDSGMMHCLGGCGIKKMYKETFKSLVEVYPKLAVVNDVLQVVN